MTFAELEYDSKKRRTRREILEKMEGLIPWQQLEDRIEPFYAKAGRGRRPYPLGVMLRVHCVQLFYNLSDPGMEDHEVESVRRFAGLRLVLRTRRRSLETSCGPSVEDGDDEDPPVHQTKKGNQCSFGMKAHIGVDGIVWRWRRRPPTRRT